jgi:type II secretory pathway predicted ATPase ExeA
MYLDHFPLTSQPFSEHTPVAALWQDQRMDEGLARLDYLIQCGQLGLVTGLSGVGKSALLKRFLHGLLPQRCQAVYCHLTHLPSAGLLKMVVAQLGETPRRGKERIYQQILERATRAESSLLLVFDEAHLLDGDALTDLRLLISSALDAQPPLKMLLVGQESLRDVLRRARHADLLNRVSVRYQLRPFSREQTCRYIDFQISQAGGDVKLFDDSVKAAIHDFTGGVPRQINNLATACLLQASAQKVVRIDDNLFQRAAGEFQLP